MTAKIVALSRTTRGLKRGLGSAGGREARITGNEE
jgi:hypothetical protein